MGGRNARALLLERSRAVLSDARSTRFYVRVSSGCEQRCLFWLSGFGQKLAAKSKALPEPHSHCCKLCVSAATRELPSSCVSCKNAASLRTRLQHSLCKAHSSHRRQPLRRIARKPPSERVLQ